jgi:HD-like signal output (HDOD) protein
MTELLFREDNAPPGIVPAARGAIAPPRPGGLAVALDDLVAEAGDLRPLPDVAQRLLALVEEDDFSLQDLALAVSADQALSAKILRIANSPFHRHARQIGTIRDAVVLLGFRTVRSAALAASLMQSTPLQANYLDYPSHWRFSVAVGLLAEMMAERTPEVRDIAFTAGVMHNLGRLALDQMAPRALAHCVELAAAQGVPLRDVQREALGFTEAELGAALATHWNYPEELVDAIAAADDAPGAGSRGELADIVLAARTAASSARLPEGLPLLAESRTPPRPDEIEAPPDVVLELTRIGGVEELYARVDAFLEGVFPDRISRSA